MFCRTLGQLGPRGAVLKSTKAIKPVKHTKNHAPELSALPPAPHLRSLQFRKSKRGTIKPIFNHEKIEPSARVDPTHPVLNDKSFKPLGTKNLYFSLTVYPNAMLKRLGVIFTPSGKLRPRPPREPDFPIFQKKKRVKFASTFIQPLKAVHKSDVVRTRIKRKLVEAIQLIVTRGANANSEGSRVVFTQSDAREAKWLLRDWYYVFFPRPEVYHASWPDLIRTTREGLSEIVQKSAENLSSWRIQVAEREAAARERVTRREMRRVRMWRRQEQAALARGRTAEDVGIKWKPKGMGPKKRRKGKSGVGGKRIKELRVPGRDAFKRGNLSPRESPKIPTHTQRTKLATEITKPQPTSTIPRRKPVTCDTQPTQSHNRRATPAAHARKGNADSTRPGRR